MITIKVGLYAKKFMDSIWIDQNSVQRYDGSKDFVSWCKLQSLHIRKFFSDIPGNDCRNPRKWIPVSGNY